jgi:hypothetical protein
MFGGPSTPPPAGPPVTTPPEAPATPAPSAPATTPEPPAAGAEGTARDQAVLGNANAEPQHLSDYIAPENPLQIGGQLYLRAQSLVQEGQAPDRWSLSAPSLLDVYLDARPNPRVRAFVLGRMSYDATAATAPTSAFQATQMPGQTTGGNGSLAAGNPTGFTTFNATRGPNSILDQMWLRFDIENRVFVTVGKQHVRWGTGRFWQPTDYLHPIKRNPLDVFDARPGASMVKLHFPWEEKGWNFYAFAIADGAFDVVNVGGVLVPASDGAANTLRQASAAGRAELVVAGVEVGLDTFLARDQRPRFGIDVSTGIYDFDVYADIALRPGEDFAGVNDAMPGAPLGNNLTTRFSVAPLSGYVVQAVGGVNYSRKYNDNDMYTVGLEYFYNEPGYTSTNQYAGLIYNNLTLGGTILPLPFFYLGKQYGAVFASFPAPYSWNYTTFTLSTLGNLSDQSFVSRVDYSLTFLTHLTFQAFLSAQYGNPNGELRFGINVPTQTVFPPNTAITSLPGISTQPAIFSLGAALLIKL